jgi:hypothetical protein
MEQRIEVSKFVDAAFRSIQLILNFCKEAICETTIATGKVV